MQAIVLLFQGLELLLEGLQAEHDTQRFMISAAISIRPTSVWYGKSICMHVLL